MKVVIFINTLTVHISDSANRATLCGRWGYPIPPSKPLDYLKIPASKELPFCKECEQRFLKAKT